MSHVVDIPPSLLIPKLAEELRGRPNCTPPAWAMFAKTGVHKQRAPIPNDWWYTRSASVLRKVALTGPVGSSRLATAYGGRKDRGSAPYHHRPGSRSIAREILQQLEGAGLVRADKKRGRRVTADGQKLLDRLSRELLKGLAEKRPELAKYL
ncbi:MAG: 30S ribosomal protein S19e [Thermoplasmata archaeon]|nr:30S ribosomal protein S19e [Thermoplasmata archaeon]MCI4342193.1 30S ribosomal protein S19e [Thermoplasmata archaeon]